MNEKDDGGVLVGKWAWPYPGGTLPTLWTGSAPILQAFHRSGGVPVKYGQCWVFAGVVNTVLRALGVPARPVTNYSSAHDTDGSCTVDLYFSTDETKRLQDLERDSVWFERSLAKNGDRVTDLLGGA